MIDGLPVLGIGQGGVLLLIVLMVLTDRLVWHKRLDQLQERIEAAEETNKQLLEQNTMLLRSAVPRVNALMNALQEAAGDGP